MRATHVGKYRSRFFPAWIAADDLSSKYVEAHGVMLQVTVSTGQSHNTKLANFERRTDIVQYLGILRVLYISRLNKGQHGRVKRD
jgi:hypothetical protein